VESLSGNILGTVQADAAILGWVASSGSIGTSSQMLRSTPRERQPSNRESDLRDITAGTSTTGADPEHRSQRLGQSSQHHRSSSMAPPEGADGIKATGGDSTRTSPSGKRGKAISATGGVFPALGPSHRGEPVRERFSGLNGTITFLWAFERPDHHQRRGGSGHRASTQPIMVDAPRCRPVRTMHRPPQPSAAALSASPRSTCTNPTASLHTAAPIPQGIWKPRSARTMQPPGRRKIRHYGPIAQDRQQLQNAVAIDVQPLNASGVGPTATLGCWT